MPFFNTYTNMNPNKDKDKDKDKDNDNDNKRPYRMINVSFPPAKYGVILAIIIIAICSLLLLIN